MKRVCAFFIIGLILCISACTSGIDASMWRRSEGPIYYEPSDEAFPNPMKGFRPARYLNATNFPTGEYVSTVHHLIKYNELESSASDTAQKIIDWSNRTWAGLERSNIKIIPRIIIANPGIGEFWPDDIDSSDIIQRWLNEPFKQRLAAFIEKLGEAWDNDPRIAAIEAGIWGYWGEHHIWPDTIPDTPPDRDSTRIPPDIQKVMGDAFTRAFKNKQVQVRYPLEFADYNFGYYWDSFAYWDDNAPDYKGDETGHLIIARDTWRVVMNSGEVAYEGAGNAVKMGLYGKDENDNLRNAQYTDYVIDWVKRTHTSSLGWIANYTQNDPSLSENTARLQKAMGYRFVVHSANFNITVAQGGKLSLEFEVANTGAAPFYYQWPVEVSLLGRQRRPVWTGIVHVDIRNWLPGGVYTVRDEFTLPENIPKATYTLALAVLDPSGNLPSLRFANKNYFNGGRMPLGTIGLGRQPNTNHLGAFDSLYSDHSLYYKLEPPSAPVEDRQHYPPAD